ncbi:MAG: PQQ-dependent sugar dehydrogenase [Pseudomonadota bacterium]
MRTIATLLVLGTALAPLSAAAQATVEQGPANAPFLEPAFANQTRAPLPAASPEIRAETVASGLPQLWAMEFLPDGRMIVNAKDGAMHVVGTDGSVGPALAGVPQVDARRQGGLLDVAVSPDFETDNTVFITYAEPREGGGNATSVASARLAVDATGAGALEDLTVIYRQMPAYRGNAHFGSRIVFAPDGTMFVGMGDRSDRGIRGEAQDLGSGVGKVVRINTDGSVPQDNPFVGDASAQPEIWSYGHRNIQSAVLGADGTLWTVEHGPRGGDELNRTEAGLNYGWPVITYGIEYSGAEIGGGNTQADGMEQPVYYWDPVIAPSGMAQYTGDAIPEWDGALLIGGLRALGVVVLHLEDGRVVSEDRVPLGARVRDVKVGPDGAVYAVTERRGGESTILRLTKAGAA